MKEYIDAVKAGDLVEAKKQFLAIMESKTDAIKQEIRVQLAEDIRIDGEEDKENDPDNKETE
ncbi:prohead core protein [Pectobacterium phage POP12]|nr:prohead core protein [Pectobacterium phage POP12]